MSTVPQVLFSGLN